MPSGGCRRRGRPRVLQQLEVQSGALKLTRTLRRVPDVRRNVDTYGTEVERAEFTRLAAQYERYAAMNDARGLEWVNAAMLTVNWTVVKEQMPYRRHSPRELESPTERFVNKEQAEKALGDAQTAEQCSDLAELRRAVQRAWRLQQPDQAAPAGPCGRPLRERWRIGPKKATWPFVQKNVRSVMRDNCVAMRPGRRRCRGPAPRCGRRRRGIPCDKRSPGTGGVRTSCARS